MTVSGWLWKGLLALAGCIVAGYVFEEVTGGGALGWTVCGAILGATCGPLFLSLLAWRRQKDAARLAARTAGEKSGNA